MTISVGAVGANGMHAFYSTAGASIFVSAPAGDVEDDSRHRTAKVGGGCTRASLGTSFATPVVSGVVALMLEVNPTLGWRDVQGILAHSSRPVDNDPEDDTAAVNSANFHHSNFFGFGIVDAAAAVDLSRSWTNYGEEKMIAIDSGTLDYPIYDDVLAETTSSIVVSPEAAMSNVQRDSNVFIVEAVEVLLDISHFSRGDLKIVLTSPSGMESILHPGKLPENGQPGEGSFWKLMTVRSWGESPFGEWKLSIRDEKAGSFKSCVDAAGFTFYYTGVEVTCEYIGKYGICANGDYNSNFFAQGNYDSLKYETDTNGITMKEACCICGGGIDENSFENKLRHWTIAIYGHEGQPVSKLVNLPAGTTSVPTIEATPLPTVAPTSLPTLSPTASSISAPTASPTASPTPLPTQEPTPEATTTSPTTSAPTASPTATPTAAPTATPTASPTASPTPNPTILSTISPTMPPTHEATSAPTQLPTTPAPSTAMPTAPVTSSPTIATFSPTNMPSFSSAPSTMSPSSVSEVPETDVSNGTDDGQTNVPGRRKRRNSDTCP